MALTRQRKIAASLALLAMTAISNFFRIPLWQYDLEVLEATMGPEIARQVRPREA